MLPVPSSRLKSTRKLPCEHSWKKEAIALLCFFVRPLWKKQSQIWQSVCSIRSASTLGSSNWCCACKVTKTRFKSQKPFARSLANLLSPKSKALRSSSYLRQRLCWQLGSPESKSNSSKSWRATRKLALKRNTLVSTFYWSRGISWLRPFRF